jgi:hypothetical protein
MHDRAFFELVKGTGPYRTSRKVEVRRTLYFDEAIVLFWKDAHHNASLSRRSMLFHVVIANICNLPELPLNGLEYTIDDR